MSGKVDIEDLAAYASKFDEDSDGEDPYAGFKSLKEMWEEAKQREVNGTVHEMAAQMGYSFQQMMLMKREKELDGKWVWKEANWARKIEDKAIKAEVTRLELALKKAEEEENATPRPVPRARNICTWVAKDSEDDVWCCNNEVLRHPETREMLYFCGYHLKSCVYMHPGDEVAIDVPNAEGACNTHYISAHDEPPEDFDSRFDVPGTVVARFNMRGIGLPTHTLAPFLKEKRKKRAVRTVKSEVDWNEMDIFEKAEYLYDSAKKHFVKRVTGDRKIARRQRRGATAVQAVWRGYRERQLMKEVRRMREVHRRNRAATVIQQNYLAHMLRVQQVENMAKVKRAVKAIEERLYEKRFWKDIQRRVKLQESACRIQKFIRQIVAQYRWGIIRAKIKARRFARLRKRMGALIVRIGHGFLGRIRFRRWKAEYWRRDAAARIIQRMVVVVVAKKEFERVRQQRILEQNQEWAVTIIQKLVRGFLGRQYAKYMKWRLPRAAAKIQGMLRMLYARRIVRQKRAAGEKFWDWLGPTMPRSTFKHLTYRVPYTEIFDLSKWLPPKEVKEKPRGMLEYYDSDAQKANWAKEREQLQVVCDGLEKLFQQVDIRKSTRVTKLQFREVMVHAGLSLNRKAIIRLQELFVDDVSGNFDYMRFLAWARKQPGLCSKHRAIICPICFYRGFCSKCRSCKRYREVPKDKITMGQGIYRIDVCQCGHSKSNHMIVKEQKGTVIYELKRGMAPHAVKMKRILEQQPATLNHMAESMALATTATIPRTETAVEGPDGLPMKVVPMSDLRSFKKARETEALRRIARASAISMAASGSRNPKYPNVFADAEEDDPDSEYNRLYNHAQDHKVDLTTEDGRGIQYPRDEDERRPEKYTGDRITRNTARIQTREARLLAGYPAYARTGRRRALDEGKYVEEMTRSRAGMEERKASLPVYRYEFGITRPVPVVKNGSFRLSTKVDAVYIHLLRRLAIPPPSWSDKPDILRDHENLMSLIFNHHSFLERHWRKLLHDIRVGEVDELLPIPEETKLELEAQLKPRPERADHLEEVFRALSYHARASELDRLGIQRTTTVNLEQIMHEGVTPKIDTSGPLLAKFPAPFPVQPPDADEPPPPWEAPWEEQETLGATAISMRDTLRSTVRSGDSRPRTGSPSRRSRPRRRRRRTGGTPLPALPPGSTSGSGSGYGRGAGSGAGATATGGLGTASRVTFDPTLSFESDGLGRSSMPPSRSQDPRLAGSTVPRVRPERRTSLPQLTLGGERVEFTSLEEKLALKTPMSSMMYATTGKFDMGHATLNQSRGVGMPVEAMDPLTATATMADKLPGSPSTHLKSPPKRRTRLSVDYGTMAPEHADALMAAHKNLHTQPRPKMGKVLEMTDARRPFLCSQPGCGKSFAAEGTLRFHFRHTHENRARLGVEMPLADYAMGMYWPKDNPWRSDGPLAPFIPIDVTDGCQYECRFCGQRFMKGFHLRNHYMAIHKKNTYVESIRAVTKAEKQPGIRWEGKPLRCPPEAPPPGVELPRCPHHQWIVPDPKCETCRQFRFQPLPHPPVLFYEAVEVDVMLNVPGAIPKVRIWVGDDAPMLLVVTPVTDEPDEEGRKPVPFPFQVSAILHDNENANWLWGCRYWNFEHVERTDFMWKPRFGFDKEREVLQGFTMEWVPLEAVVGLCHVECCSAVVFRNMGRDGVLPTDRPCFFCREPAMPGLEALVEEGIFHTTKAATAVPSPRKYVTRRPKEHTGTNHSRMRFTMRTAETTNSMTRRPGGKSKGTTTAVAASPKTPKRGSSLSGGPSTESLKLPTMGPGNLAMYKNRTGKRLW